MWVKRTEDEVAKSIANAKSDAFVHGMIIGGAVWVLMTTMIAGGWLVNFSLGIAIQTGGDGDFWQRVPRSSLMTLPLAAFAFWYERRKALRKELGRTIAYDVMLLVKPMLTVSALVEASSLREGM